MTETEATVKTDVGKEEAATNGAAAADSDVKTEVKKTEDTAKGAEATNEDKKTAEAANGDKNTTDVEMKTEEADKKTEEAANGDKKTTDVEMKTEEADEKTEEAANGDKKTAEADKETEEAANGDKKTGEADKETEEAANGDKKTAEADKKTEEAANGDKKTEEAANGDAKSDVLAKVKRQLEYYFGNYNLPKDKFLKETIKESEGGWVSLDIMLKFQRLAHITTDQDVILEAIKDSKLLEANTEKKEIRRLPSLPVPDFNEDTRKAHIAKSIYAKGFEKEKTTLDDLIKFFEPYEGVINVIRRTYGKDTERFFKGSVFVTFTDKESAQKFLDLEEVKSPEGEVLVRKWQQDYFDEKDKENEGKRKARHNTKMQNKQAKEALEEKAEEETSKLTLPTGAILVLEGFKNADTKREDIKDALKDKFEVKADEAIAFVYFNKGEKEAKLRFSSENAAKDLAKKISESLKEGEKFTVNEDQLEVKVLEGQEETDFLEKCKSDIANQKGRNRKGHKRHSGRPGGYRGPPKRQRNN